MSPLGAKWHVVVNIFENLKICFVKTKYFDVKKKVFILCGYFSLIGSLKLIAKLRQKGAKTQRNWKKIQSVNINIFRKDFAILKVNLRNLKIFRLFLLHFEVLSWYALTENFDKKEHFVLRCINVPDMRLEIPSYAFICIPIFNCVFLVSISYNLKKLENLENQVHEDLSWTLLIQIFRYISAVDFASHRHTNTIVFALYKICFR